MHKEYYHLNKIWCSYRSKDNAFVYDDTKEYIGLTNTTVIFDTNKDINLKYVLALLNSQLFRFRYTSIGKQTGGGIFEYVPNAVGKFPIKAISQDRQKPFIELVDTMHTLQESYHRANTTHDRTLYQRHITALDARIDALAYELYGLSAEEIRVVGRG